MPQAFIKDPELEIEKTGQVFWPPARVGLLDSAGLLLDHLQGYLGFTGQVLV